MAKNFDAVKKYDSAHFGGSHISLCAQYNISDYITCLRQELGMNRLDNGWIYYGIYFLY